MLECRLPRSRRSFMKKIIGLAFVVAVGALALSLPAQAQKKGGAAVTSVAARS